MSEDAYVRAYIPTCETYGWTGGPVFSTRIVTRQNGRENRNADWAQPQHEFALPFQGLTQDQYVPIKRMHLNRRGAWGVFLYRDRSDDRAVDETFALGDGTIDIAYGVGMDWFNQVLMDRVRGSRSDAIWAA